MLQQQIKSDMIAGMKAKEPLKVEVMRGLMAAFTNELVATKKKPDEPVTDEMAIAVIRREVKKRKDASEQFRAGKRPELADKEDAEQKMLEAYLPAMMSREEIEKVVIRVKEEMAKAADGSSPGALDKALRGKFMGAVMKELAGKADGADVKAVIDSLFA